MAAHKHTDATKRIGDRLRQLSESAVLPASPAQEEVASAPRTVAGQAAYILRREGELQAEFEQRKAALESERSELEARFAGLEGALPARKLDPADIEQSRFPNRHESHFVSAQYRQLKADIQAQGGNVQAILVRPLPGGPVGKYECVYGHRRLHSCRELGLPVLAIIQPDLSDKDLVALREQENRSRADVSLYERGLLYQRALDEATYESERKLAEELGVARATLQRCLHAARLAPAILNCFENPCVLQARGVELLHSAYEADADSLLRRAEVIQASGKRLAYAAALKALLGQDDRAGEPRSLEAKGRKIGTCITTSAGGLSIALLPTAVPAERRAAFVRELEAVLGRFAGK